MNSSSLLTRHDLDGLVINVELTLISIIQGVALYFLVEHSRGIITERQWEFFPYIAIGLFTLLTFWSRSIIHTLTVIRWPLQFGHNFLYITATFVECILFTQLREPLVWFALQILFAIVLWFLFISDLKIIQRRIQDSPGHWGNLLYQVVLHDQKTNMVFLFPCNIAFNALAFFLLKNKITLFSFEYPHWLFALPQAGIAFFYLSYGVLFYRRLAHSIVQTHQEWNRA